MNRDGFLMVAVFCLASWLFGVYGGFNAGIRIAQNEAIEAGVGRWTVDEVTGYKTFVYGSK